MNTDEILAALEHIICPEGPSLSLQAKFAHLDLQVQDLYVYKSWRCTQDESNEYLHKQHEFEEHAMNYLRSGDNDKALAMALWVRVTQMREKVKEIAPLLLAKKTELENNKTYIEFQAVKAQLNG